MLVMIFIILFIFLQFKQGNLNQDLDMLNIELFVFKITVLNIDLLGQIKDHLFTKRRPKEKKNEKLTKGRLMTKTN